MSDRELYLAIGVPALIGIANLGAVITLVLWFASRVENRIDRLEGKIDQTNTRIDKLGEDYTRFYGEQRVQDARITAIENKP